MTLSGGISAGVVGGDVEFPKHKSLLMGMVFVGVVIESPNTKRKNWGLSQSSRQTRRLTVLDLGKVLRIANLNLANRSDTRSPALTNGCSKQPCRAVRGA